LTHGHSLRTLILSLPGSTGKGKSIMAAFIVELDGQERARPNTFISKGSWPLRGQAAAARGTPCYQALAFSASAATKMLHRVVFVMAIRFALGGDRTQAGVLLNRKASACNQMLKAL
jgi:hypothetical protein